MRFMKEYASWKRKQIRGYALMKEEYKAEKLQAVDRILRLVKQGLITVDEAMKEMAKV